MQCERTGFAVFLNTSPVRQFRGERFLFQPWAMTTESSCNQLMARGSCKGAQEPQPWCWWAGTQQTSRVNPKAAGLSSWHLCGLGTWMPVSWHPAHLGCSVTGYKGGTAAAASAVLQLPLVAPSVSAGSGSRFLSCTTTAAIFGNKVTRQLNARFNNPS